MCDKTCIFFSFPIIDKYFLMAKCSLLSRCPSYYSWCSFTALWWTETHSSKVSHTTNILHKVRNYFSFFL